MMQLNRLAMACLISLFLVSCSDEDVDELCEVPLSIAGGPDLGATTSYTDLADVAITTATAGTSIKILVPVDAGTRSVIVDLAPVGSTIRIGSPASQDAGDRIIDNTAETIAVTYPVPGGAAGSYYPVVIGCSDTVAAVGGDVSLCNPSAAFVEDTTNVIATSNYARVIYDPTADTFVDPAVDTIGALNTCVAITAISIL
jgi:hypothetical protein